jgi:hypothetical protein
MLSSPDAKGSEGERFGLGGSRSVAKPKTILMGARVTQSLAPPLRSATRLEQRLSVR